MPSILSGLPPREHGHCSFFYSDREHSPFKALKPLGALPRSLVDRGRVRNQLSKLVKRAYGVTGYFQLYSVPLSQIGLFAYCEKKDLFKPDGLNRGEHIFDVLERDGVPFYVSNWREPEAANLAALKADMEQADMRFVFLYMAAMDALLHQVGKESPEVDNESFAGAVPVLRLLLGAILSTAVQLNAANVLAMNGQHKFIALAMAASALLNLVLSVILIQEYGLNGVALATLFAAFTVEVPVIIPRACWSRGISLWRFFREAIWPVLPPLAPALAAAYGLDHLQPAVDGFQWVFLQGATAALVYYLTFYLTSVRAEERLFIAAKLKRRSAIVHPGA